MKTPTGVDFETEKIEMRPSYPPKPVGVAIKYPGKKSKYLAWGHPSGNNTTKEAATEELRKIFKEDRVVFHHGKFDMDVAETHLGVSPPSVDRMEDTLLLGFLEDPHSRQLGLKPLSVKYLDREPKERDNLKDWIIENVPEARRAKSEWGAYISKAPAELVSPYACADTDMTVDIHKVIYKKVIEDGMLGAYRRELKLIPILLENERRGVRVNLELLEHDVPIFEGALLRLDVWIRKYIEAPPELNIDSDQQFADALENAGLVKDWVYTTPDKNGKGGGKRSVSKGALAEMLDDKLLLSALEYRGAVATFTRTFLTSWRDIAREADGWVFTTWNSTAQAEGGGTRTGRISSSKPANFTNIPSGERYEELTAKLAGAGLFKKLKWLPQLPQCRKYVIADNKNSVILGRDFSQQEPRVLAHFEDGILCEAYNKDPRMDVYVFAMGEMLRITGRKVTRKHMKVIILAILYGLGSGELAKRLGCTVVEAKAFKEAFLSVFPGVKELNSTLRSMARNNQPMRTWGGRLYYCEPPKVIKGVLRSFEYKLINFLVQGSSSDVTKESLIRYNESKRESRFLLTVYDENTICSPKKCWKQEMKILKEAMEGVPLDAPLTSDGYVGDNWLEGRECE